MEKRITKVPVYKTEKIQTGERDKELYIAIDGKEFDTENGCINYEKKLQGIKDGEQYLNKIDLCDNPEALIYLLFDGYNVSSDVCFYLWTATKDEHVIEKTISFLRAKEIPIYNNQLSSFSCDEKVLIASWTESEGSDYPSYETKAIRLIDVIEGLNKLTNSVTELNKSK